MKVFNKMVSVVIPVFNAVNFIEQAVNSAVSFEEVGELILVEDGSKDESYNICFELQSKFKKVRLITHPKRENKGAALSRNLGIINSSFDLISFLDADDVYYPNRFEWSLKVLMENPNVDACFGMVEMIYEDSNIKKIFGTTSWDGKSSLLTYLLRGGYFHTNSITVRKSFFEQVGYFNQDCWPHEDIELWIRMASIGKLAQIESREPIATYCIHANNLSKNRIINSQYYFYKILWGSRSDLNFSNLQKVLILKKLFKSIING
ncbi:glycosyltransferase family A protein [Algoriphagus sp.]|uniref:glycosyltransferase family 2 protein n=1 Tax=Algoriphagus sp. TaxID=1872435 RepID=UPI002628CA07|nr:glycosyltransferase family A protein [Algoriphagus sp.]